MLMQLPTPLDCISSAPRWPPSQAPASERHALLLARQRHRAHRRSAATQLDQPRMPGIGHIADLPDFRCLQSAITRRASRDIRRFLGSGMLNPSEHRS